MSQIDKKPDKLITQQQQNSGSEDSSFDLKTHLESYGFKHYDKMKPAIDKGDLTFEDILDCDEKELINVLTSKDEPYEFGIDLIQAKRAVRAIKKLPKSKMNMQSNQSAQQGGGGQAVIVYDSSLAKKVDQLQSQIDEQEEMTILTATAVVQSSAQNQRRHENMKTTVNNQGRGMQTLDEKTETNVEDIRERQRKNQAQIRKNMQEISQLNFVMELIALATFVLLLGVVLFDVFSGFYSKINIVNMVLLAFAVIFWLPVAFDVIYLRLKLNCLCLPDQEKWQLWNAVKDCVLNLIMTGVTPAIGATKLFSFSKSEKYTAITIDIICVVLLCVLIGGSLSSAFKAYGDSIRLSKSEGNNDNEPTMAVTDKGGTSDTNENNDENEDENKDENKNDVDDRSANGHSSDSGSGHNNGKKSANHSNSNSKDFISSDMIYPSSASDMGKEKAVNRLNTKLIEKKRKDIGLPAKSVK